MEPWQSWTIIGIAGAGAYWYYFGTHPDTRKAIKVSPASEQSQDARRRTESESKRKKDNTSGTSDQAMSDVTEVASSSVPSSSNEQTRKRKGGNKAANAHTKSSAADVEPSGTHLKESVGKEEEIDNREFAKQLSGVKHGANLMVPEKSGQSVRTKKQGKANGFVDRAFENASGKEGAISSTSSTTGADADDDLSPANSPQFGASSFGSVNSGIHDMLETPTPGPSVLRLTESTKPQRPSAPKSVSSAQALETKKQRQRKAKNEARKAEREDAEKERRVLLEKQLRTARESEGRPTKNGVPVSKPPASNVWSKSYTGPAIASAAPENADNTAVPLLDTLDNRAKAGTSGNSNDWQKDVPSEEEQLRLLSEQEDAGWETVVKPKKQRGEKYISQNTPVLDSSHIPDELKYLPFKDKAHVGDSKWTVE